MKLGIVLGAIVSAVMAVPAHAALIAAFSQNPSLTPTVTATDNGSATHIVIDDVSTNVSTGAFTGSVLFSLDANSIDPVTNLGGVALLQHYSGTFCFSGAADCGGTNFLSGVFSDAAFGGIGGPGLVLNVNNPPDQLALTSDVVPSNELGAPNTFSLTFADLNPVLHQNGTTIAGFTADYSGTVSSSAVNTIEPGSIAILGTALIGLGMVRLRKRNDGAQA